jgi:hypothetical protein
MGPVEGEPQGPVESGGDHRRHGAAGGQQELGDISTSGDAANPVRTHSGVPQGLIGSNGEAERGAAGCDREGRGLLTGGDAPDAVVAGAGEP